MNSLVADKIEKNLKSLKDLCGKLDVRELRIFGSALTDQFDPSHSDLDFVADFHQPDSPGIADRFMSLANGLEAIFNLPADLITKPAIKNPVFRRIIEEKSVPLYAS